MTDPCCTIFEYKSKIMVKTQNEMATQRHADVPAGMGKPEKTVQTNGWIIDGQKRLLWDSCPTNKYL